MELDREIIYTLKMNDEEKMELINGLLIVESSNDAIPEILLKLLNAMEEH